MRQRIILAMVAVGLCTVSLLRCGEDTLAGGASETGNASVGMLRVETYDAPPPVDVEHVYLQFTSIDARHADSGWQAARGAPLQVDYIGLINGRTALLTETALPLGAYTMLRVELDSIGNQVTVGGRTYPLIVPSGESRGVQVKTDFTLNETGCTVYLDFDIAQSISWNNGNDYRLQPVFKAAPANSCGRIRGTVRDTGSQPVGKAVVQARSTTRTHTTLSDHDGEYTLILAVDEQYTLSCMSAASGTGDTSYAVVSVVAGETSGGYDFVAR